MRVKSLSFVVALLLWLASVFEMLIIAVKVARGQVRDTVVGALFSQGTFADHVAPVAILIVFGWLLVELLWHGLRLRREGAAVATIKGWPARALREMPDDTRAGRRAALVGNLEDTPRRLHEALPSQAGLDAANLENAYSMTKTLVWLLPVLGFIGTAWGMAHAIGGFSEALGETTDPRVLADRLGQKVIPGLSSAFSTTMLALAAAMIAHYCVSGLQALDHELLRQLDEACVSRLAQTPGAESGAGGGIESSSSLIHSLGMMSNSLNELARQTGLKEAGSRLTQAGQVLGESATRMRELAELMHRDAMLPYQVTIKGVVIARWGGHRRGETAVPVEMRFIDMFMAALGALVFLAMLLSYLLKFMKPEVSGVRPTGEEVGENAALHVVTKALPNATRDEPYEVAFAYRGGKGTVAWELAAGAAEIGKGLTFDATAGVLSGRPNAEGHIAFVLRARDAENGNDERAYELTISPSHKAGRDIERWLGGIMLAVLLLVLLVSVAAMRHLKGTARYLAEAWNEGHEAVEIPGGLGVREQVELPEGIHTYETRARSARRFSLGLLLAFCALGTWFVLRLWFR